MKVNYSYQQEIALDLLNNVLTDKYIASVLGGTPGCGKTTISHIIIRDFVQKFPNAKVLVLTHNMNVLKNQYLNDLKNSHVQLNFTFGDFRTDSQVRIGIPSSIKDLDWETVDLLIVDEAHEYWGQPMVTSIYKEFSPSYVILLTGSPSSFTMHNKAVDVQFHNNKKYYISYISGSDLSENNVFSSVSLDSVVGGKTTKSDLDVALTRAKSKGYDMSKIMIACKTIDQANIISYNMKEKGFKVALSTSEDDSDSEQFEKFISGEKNVLVIVKRGVLGFSDVNLTLLIDMRCSSDLDIRFQLLARVLRKHPNGLNKAYLTVTSDINKEVKMLNKMINFTKRDFFTTYLGK